MNTSLFSSKIFKIKNQDMKKIYFNLKTLSPILMLFFCFSFTMVAQTGNVTGTVYNDLNGNGIKDGTEVGISAAVLFADINANGVNDSGEPTATTNSSGLYTISGIPVGTYNIIAENKGLLTVGGIFTNLMNLKLHLN